MNLVRINRAVFLLSWLTCLLTAVAGTATASARSGGSAVATQEGSVGLDELFNEVMGLFSPEHRDSLGLRTVPLRCATALVARVHRHFDEFAPWQRAQLDGFVERPGNLELSFPSQAGYRIHYTLNGEDAVSDMDADGNSVPDFIDSVAAAFDFSHQVEVTALGYLPPPDDFGIDGPEYDVYIQELNRGGASGLYGLTIPERPIPATPQNDMTSFIKLDNDFDDGQFTSGVPAAQVTAAHELFHAIQLGVRDVVADNEIFYYELCSSWVEDVVYDEVNDYYNTVSKFMRNTDFPLNLYQIGVTYGAAIWNHFLVQKTGDADIIRETWEVMRQGTSATDAIHDVLNSGHSFQTLFTEFGIWNYFTGARAMQDSYHEEGHNYASVQMRLNAIIGSDTTIVDSVRTLSSRYYRLVTQNNSDYLFTLKAQRPRNWGSRLIVERPFQAPEVKDAPAGESVNLAGLPQGSAIVVIASNTEALADNAPRLLRRSFASFEMNLVQLFQSQGVPEITAVYPSPFLSGSQRQVVFEFTPQATINVEARVINASGIVVRKASLVGGDHNLTSSRFVWDGRTDSGQPAPSGVFIFQLKQGTNMSYRKFAVIRE